jgi:hypothetical protein
MIVKEDYRMLAEKRRASDLAQELVACMNDYGSAVEWLSIGVDEGWIKKEVIY